MSALMIQNNEVMVDTYSNKEETRYGFIVYLLKDGDIHTKIVSTLPNFPYNSKKEAKEIGDLLVGKVKKMNLTQEVSEIEKTLMLKKLKLFLVLFVELRDNSLSPINPTKHL